MNTETREVTVNLTDEQIAAKTKAYGEEAKGLATFNEEVKTIRREQSSKVMNIKKTMDDLMDCITTKQETTKIEVQPRLNIVERTVEYMRTDNGELFESRPMNESELRENFPEDYQENIETPEE
jgi:hypothetical protein